MHRLKYFALLVTSSPVSAGPWLKRFSSSSGSLSSWCSRWKAMPSAVAATAWPMWWSNSSHSRWVENAPPWAIMSSRATSNTFAPLIFTQSFRVYSSPGRLIQWHPTAMRLRASSWLYPSRIKPLLRASSPENRGHPFLFLNR